MGRILDCCCTSCNVLICRDLVTTIQIFEMFYVRNIYSIRGVVSQTTVDLMDGLHSSLPPASVGR